MKNTLLSIFAFLCVLSLTVSGQTRGELEEYFDEGQFFFKRGDFEDAAFFFLKLVQADSLNANYNFKLGESYLNIPGKEHLAIPYFEMATRKIVPKKSYYKRAFDESAAPLHVYFYLGNAYRINNQLDKALECYMKFIDSPYFYGNYNQNIVEQEIKSCERAKIIQDAPLAFVKINLGSAINTSFSEEKPVISGNGQTLVFIRKLRFYDAIFFSRKIDNEWQTATNINPQILSDGDFYPSGLSYDGNILLLIKKDDDNYDVYYSVYEGDVWSKAKRLGNKINSLFDEVSASFGINDETIYLSSNRKGGKGGYDIYVSKQNNSGEWSRPKNLGKQINSDLDERDATYCNDQDLLFFSSQGHYTMGGYDIFYSRKSGKKWHVPLNIGYPINNTGDNLFYSPSKENCREGYYTFNDPEGMGESDIYLIRITSENTLNFSNSDSDE